MKTRHIHQAFTCDKCGTREEGLTDGTPTELRKQLKAKGWTFLTPIAAQRQGTDILDLCPECAAIDG